MPSHDDNNDTFDTRISRSLIPELLVSQLCWCAPTGLGSGLRFPHHHHHHHHPSFLFLMSYVCIRTIDCICFSPSQLGTCHINRPVRHRSGERGAGAPLSFLVSQTSVPPSLRNLGENQGYHRRAFANQLYRPKPKPFQLHKLKGCTMY